MNHEYLLLIWLLLMVAFFLVAYSFRRWLSHVGRIDDELQKGASADEVAQILGIPIKVVERHVHLFETGGYYTLFIEKRREALAKMNDGEAEDDAPDEDV